MHPKNISINDFEYHLPEDRIAAFPLAERDLSKLLIYRNGQITEDIYRNIASYLPGNALLLFNDTKVIKARILFQKITGAVIEIFCLEPYGVINDYAVVMQQRNSSQWKCMIGGAGKWKDKFLTKELIVNNERILLKAELIEKLPDAYVVELSWDRDDLALAEIFEHAGVTPLPPYIKRKADDQDIKRYQSIYAAHEGSVAAPTAGLHFTDHIFCTLAKKGITTKYVTLHVGAGTFKPVKAATMGGHEMHAEWIDVSAELVKYLSENSAGKILCVGTTSVRTIESLYWMGLKVMNNPGINLENLVIQQWDVYGDEMAGAIATSQQCLDALYTYLLNKKLEHLFIQTRIIIAPGYRFKIADGMITNFHQPKSTLLLLVAAMIGENWKAIYEHALKNDYRFLSYGDGCLIFKD